MPIDRRKEEAIHPKPMSNDWMPPPVGLERFLLLLRVRRQRPTSR
jgi:hypothetical protein